MIFSLSEKKIVWKTLQIDPSKSTDPFAEMFGVLCRYKDSTSKLFVKIISKLRVRNIFVILHDRVNFREDARMKNDLHLIRLLDIF